MKTLREDLAKDLVLLELTGAWYSAGRLDMEALMTIILSLLDSRYLRASLSLYDPSCLLMPILET